MGMLLFLALLAGTVYGLLVGFVVYSVFNLTSYSIFNWPLSTAIIDTFIGRSLAYGDFQKIRCVRIYQ